MTPLQAYWTRMAEKHGLTVDVPFRLTLSDGAEIVADVRLRGYGAENGMLIVSDESALIARSDEIVAMGYGYSCSCFLPPQELDPADLSDVLDDWGKLTE